MEDRGTNEFVRLVPMMAHNVIHELSVARSAMDLLISDNSIPPDTREKLSLVKGAVGQATAQATQLLKITGTEDSHLAVLDIQEVLSDLSPLLQLLLGEDIQLRLELELDLWPIKIAVGQFEEMFCNLVVNARHAMPNGGTLQICATNIADTILNPGFANGAHAHHVLIEIADTGVGIAEAVLGQIFEPFFTTKGAGCGFGLAMVWETIKTINGYIAVKSEIGNGTTFSFLYHAMHLIK